MVKQLVRVLFKQLCYSIDFREQKETVCSPNSSSPKLFGQVFKALSEFKFIGEDKKKNSVFTHRYTIKLVNKTNSKSYLL